MRNGWVWLVRYGGCSLRLACRAWPMLLLDACQHTGCEIDSVSLLHLPRLCLAGAFAVSFMQVLRVRRRMANVLASWVRVQKK